MLAASPLLADAGLSLADLDDDDPAFAQALRVLLWDTYQQAGCPLGEAESAMLAWWAFGQGTTVQ